MAETSIQNDYLKVPGHSTTPNDNRVLIEISETIENVSIRDIRKAFINKLAIACTNDAHNRDYVVLVDFFDISDEKMALEKQLLPL